MYYYIYIQYRSVPDLKSSDTDCLRWAGCEGALKAGGGCDGSTDKDAELRPSTEVTSGEQLPATAATDGPSGRPKLHKHFSQFSHPTITTKHDQLW